MSLTLGLFLVGIAVSLTVGIFVVYNHGRAGNQAQKSNPLEDWAILASGTSGDIELERAWLRKVQELYGIFCAKQHDYGPTNIAVGGAEGVAFRIGDKTSRLWELTGLRGGKKKTASVSEPLRDTFLDLADYGIIAALVLDGDWKLQSPTDVWGVEAAERVLLDLKNGKANS